MSWLFRRRKSRADCRHRERVAALNRTRVRRRSVNLAVAEVQRQKFRRKRVGGFRQRLSGPVGHPDEAARQRPVGMNQPAIFHSDSSRSDARPTRSSRSSGLSRGRRHSNSRARRPRARRALAASGRRSRRGAGRPGRTGLAAPASGRRSSSSRSRARLAIRARQCRARCERSPEAPKLGEHRNRNFGGGRRGRSAAVGGMVDQRGVGLVADSGDQRDRAFGGGADHLLLVERPQILDRAAAASDDQKVGRGRLRQSRPSRRSRESRRRSSPRRPPPGPGPARR
jgi:hypothetical protein